MSGLGEGFDVIENTKYGTVRWTLVGVKALAVKNRSRRLEAAEKRSTSKTCPALQLPEHCSPSRAAAWSLHAESIGNDIGDRRSCEPALLGRLTESYAVLVSKGLLRFSLGTHSERDGIISYSFKPLGATT